MERPRPIEIPEEPSCQLIKQRLGLFQIARVKAFGEPAVDRSEKIAGLVPLALIALIRLVPGSGT